MQTTFSTLKRSAIYFFAFLLVGLVNWLQLSFDSPTIDQIVFHLQYNEDLLDKSASTFLLTFSVEVVAFPVAWTLIAMAIERLTAEARSRWWPRVQLGPLRFLGRSFPLAAVAMGAMLLLMQLSAFSYVRARFGDDYFATHYVNPATVQVSPGGPIRNLLLVYVESLEESYSDSSIFGSDMTLPIKQQGGFSFASYEQVPGSGWTMGGIVSTQCAAPLKPIALPGKTELEERLFMRNAVCLGDILKSAGYRNIFMGGARTTFAGKGRFLADHGYERVYGKKDWLESGYTFGRMNDWGLHDDDLLAQAKQQLRKLQASGERFNLTILTLDTHHPRGFYSKTCRDMGAKDFSGVVHCTTRQVAKFLSEAKRDGLLRDTRVVVIGDHLSMPNPVYEKLSRVPRRTIFNRFITADEDEMPQKMTERLIPFDMLPTVLEFVGFEVPGGKLGLGRSGFSATARQRSEDELDDLKRNVLNPSDTYVRLWMTED